ncbi:MAG: sigma-54-dependent Fis family transcriptional regulator [Desulfobacteraceae bacterium]|nr:MAG: sigma-54-dependent Fis family transcriptional regulator [Desulfobacteraceae bacterium]
MDAKEFRILAVDDNANTLEVIKRNLNKAGYAVLTCTDVPAAVKILEEHLIDVLITDYKMPKYDGLDLLTHAGENYPHIGMIMVTGYPSINGAIQAVKKGADEYLAKPFTDAELLDAVAKVVLRLSRRQEARTDGAPASSFGMVGSSPSMRAIFRLIEKAASMSANVLISGESGTGKELVARAIHYGSARSAAPFVSVNCTAIPESLLESELFGHVKGAFTGAKEARDGFFQIADRGTIFLDEIGDASLNLQAKLLRVIQSKEFFRVGSSQVSKVDTRVITATHKNLPEMVSRGLFREDLFYRLNIIDISIPPLRERKEEVPTLVRHFTADFCRQMGRAPLTFSDRALEALTEYAWPGNVRELENLTQKLVVMVDGERVDIADLPETMRFSIHSGPGGNRTLAQMEVDHIMAVLESVGGNKSRAAAILGIDRKTLREKLRKIQK